jgi:hypothetical protein
MHAGVKRNDGEPLEILKRCCGIVALNLVHVPYVSLSVNLPTAVYYQSLRFC